LYPLLPHDRVEILAVAAGGSLVPLSGSAPKRRWSTGGGTVEPFTAIVSRFGSAPTLLIENSEELGADGSWSLGPGAAPAQPARAVIGARLEVGGQVVGYLLLGSVARDAYRPEDEDILAFAALLVAPRVHGLRLAAELDGQRAQPSAEESPDALGRSALALAATSHLGEALRAYGESLAGLLPHEAMALHLRWGEDEVIAIDPVAPRPFADVPGIPIHAFEAGPVLRGEREWLVRSVDGREEIVVPLRVAGRVIGTLAVRARGFPSTRDAAALVQQFADVLAPHLELLRRAAAVSGPGKWLSAR
jgi:GAF domain-containing protein